MKRYVRGCWSGVLIGCVDRVSRAFGCFLGVSLLGGEHEGVTKTLHLKMISNVYGGRQGVRGVKGW